MAIFVRQQTESWMPCPIQTFYGENIRSGHSKPHRPARPFGDLSSKDCAKAQKPELGPHRPRAYLSTRPGRVPHHLRQKAHLI
ncbi:hypothetical protein IKE71_01580 [Candidatus Saccharibacteria bacterium]|nr:hypothetical protein [Candidatus Saccharibacteria bacterium]